jgi:DNA-binding PadR family transcriptional regulator
MDSQDLAGLLPLTPATFHILLSLHDGPMHGYGIKREVEQRTGHMVRLGAGTLYEAIQRLDRLGLIRDAKPPAGIEADSKRGKKVLRAEYDRLANDLKHAQAKGLAGRLSKA